MTSTPPSDTDPYRPERPDEGFEAQAERAPGLALELLGPASQALLRAAARRKAVAVRLQEGADLEDAVLAEVHAHLSEEGGLEPLERRQLAGEFTSYLMVHLERVGALVMPKSSGLRRLHETIDLVNSVFGDVLPEIHELDFTNRRSFLALLKKRVDWKAMDKARQLQAGNRREDRRVSMPAEDELQAAADSQPLGESITNEERLRLTFILRRLSERDRELIKLYIAGHDHESIAAELGVNSEAARKALGRAIERARRLAGGESDA